MTGELHWLALAGVFFSIIGVFYYLCVVKLRYFDTAEAPLPLAVSTNLQIAVSVNSLAVLSVCTAVMG